MGGQVANRRQHWALLAVILLAFVLSTYDLGRKELWFDEVHSVVIASKDWAGILAYTQSAPFEHPPLYYLVLHSWMQLAGTGEFALRFSSVFWGVLLIALLYRFMASWGGRSFALLAALVAALFTPYIDHSQNVRMYTLMPVLGVLLLICFFRGLATKRRRWWVGFLLVTFLGIATHYYFFLLLLVPTVFLLLSGRRYRRLLAFLLVIQLGCVLLIAGWFWLSPGFRQAVQQILSGEGGGVSSLWQRVMHTAGGLLLEEPVVGHLALGALALVGAFLWPLPSPPRAHPMSLVGSRRFVLIWLLVPWLVALAIPYWLQDRHLAYVWPALYALIACGLLVLRAKGKVLFAAGLLLVGVTAGYGLCLGDSQVEFQFGQIMAYIEDRALPDDLVIMNQPALWPFVDYYRQQDLAVAYVPAEAQPYSEATVDQQMRSLVADRSRIWLGPIGAWTEDPESLVEQWLATRAFQAYKEWFPGSGSAALYYAPGSLEPLRVDQAIEWEDRVRLLGASSSSTAVAPGDAVRLSLTWQAIQSTDSPHLVSLYLVDEMGQVWAERQSEPCSGWCPTATWEPASYRHDHHALMIPPGTPPGSYRLQVAWYLPGEGRELAAGGSGQRADLGEVQVLQAGQPGVAASPLPVIPHPLQAEFAGQVVLQGFDLAQTQVSAGEAIAVDLHWLAKSSLVDDYTLQLELVGPDGQAAASWERSPAADFFPTGNWQAGEYIRGLQWLSLPPQVAPGRYQLHLKLLDPEGQPLPLSGSRSRQVLGGLIRWQAPLGGEGLELGTLEVSEQPERPRNFGLPAIAHPLNVQLGKQVELLGYDLDTRLAMAGGQIELTLYWRGRGATDRPHKVFTHLSDDSAPLAQHDGPPGEGCCPTDTWVEGEVVVDRHVIPLAADLPPNTYRLMVGMYDEHSGERLPVHDALGRERDETHVLIAEVLVLPGNTPGPAPVRAEMTHRIYLPLVEGNP